jgi:type IV pilus assembly protein PilV
MKKNMAVGYRNKQLNRGSAQMQQGVVMLESLIAILIFSMGVIALVGLQAAMLKNTSEARYRAEATFIAQQKLGEVWINAKAVDALSGYAEQDKDISAYLPGGKRTVTVSSAPECRLAVTVSWQSPGGDVHNYSTDARINSMLQPDTCIYL